VNSPDGISVSTTVNYFKIQKIHYGSNMVHISRKKGLQFSITVHYSVLSFYIDQPDLVVAPAAVLWGQGQPCKSFAPPCDPQQNWLQGNKVTYITVVLTAWQRVAGVKLH